MINIIDNIRKKQDELILMINSTFDEIIREIAENGTCEIEKKSIYETIHPLTNTAAFKGKKVIGVIINDERIVTPTWKTVVKTILNHVLEDKENLNKMLDLRDKVLGRVRTRISKSKDGMRSPLELRKELYIETHYDTETLMNFLLSILNDLSYDFSNIKVIIKN